jgi:hypothetical protein
VVGILTTSPEKPLSPPSPMILRQTGGYPKVNIWRKRKLVSDQPLSPLERRREWDGKLSASQGYGICRSVSGLDCCGAWTKILSSLGEICSEFHRKLSFNSSILGVGGEFSFLSSVLCVCQEDLLPGRPA